MDGGFYLPWTLKTALERKLGTHIVNENAAIFFFFSNQGDD